MTQTEFDLLSELLRVFDQARSHFIFEVCEPSVRRFLNAMRIHHEEENDVRMPWAEYKRLILDRMQNSSTIDGLLSYVIKPRENNCPIGLWVAERVAERKLLNEDGIDMSEDTWLELTLSFVTNEEKQTLQIPARDRRPEMAGGYGVPQLQRALAQFDPSTFKPFRQANCKDPVALRVIEIDRLCFTEKKKALAPHPAKKEVFLAEKPAKKPVPLPVKDGAPDQTIYNGFPAGSLRRRVWDAIVATKCPRCQGDHLRVSCPKPRQAWEDDFEKDDFFTKSYVKPKKPAAPKKQGRVQLSAGVDLSSPVVLWVTCPSGRCLVDTCSDVSLAKRDALSNKEAAHVSIEHLGGETVLEESGVFSMDGPLAGPYAVCLSNVMAVDADQLPDGFIALIGLPDARCLALSLDYIMAHPGCDWRLARPTTCLERMLRFLGLRRPLVPLARPFAPARRSLSRPKASVEQPEECLPRPPLSRDLSREGLAPAPEEGSSSFSVPAKPPSRYARTDAAQFYDSLPVEEPDVHHRGKWYAIRRGRKTGVFSS
jgi:hypothetical protein